jgi:hypothetical protein
MHTCRATSFRHRGAYIQHQLDQQKEEEKKERKRKRECWILVPGTEKLMMGCSRGRSFEFMDPIMKLAVNNGV